MENLKNVKRYHRNIAIILGIFLLILICMPLFISKSPYIMNVFILVFYMTTLSMAWNLLGGMTGQNSLGHAAYMGLGAYACCLLMTKTDVNPWLCGLFGMVVVGLVAGIVFYPCFILKGPYFTLVTIAFGEAIRQFIINWDFAGKAIGISLSFGKDSWADFRFMSKTPYYYVGLAMVIGIYLLMKKIDRSKLGFALKTTREDEDTAAAIGINPTKYKVIAVVISAMIAGMVGFFYASYNRYIDPDLMLQSYSVESVLPAVVGGAAFVEGPLVGGGIMITLSEFLRNEFGAILPGINLLMYAIVLIAVIRFRPSGILGWYMDSKAKKFVDENILKKPPVEDLEKAQALADAAADKRGA
ncbi:MAG: branched-chain amino acid ABC transporter permease [Solobacterium sp.]|jgi:branched-chain amino acid transport system permease protein|nr:branched-chain amino acid ABC transporter permease [Solobacterium sp.]MCH4206087.1 branched-chain amino acid ABC transporter permease [Solobacterium sp.]MCH4227553.1 branched-chain amino acid ABC transporter permease [Solobacterium sp.]MCH4282977.1 branched-chain amino acid ABC transporter permease [Solobacterium sp.]